MRQFPWYFGSSVLGVLASAASSAPASSTTAAPASPAASAAVAIGPVGASRHVGVDQDADRFLPGGYLLVRRVASRGAFTRFMLFGSFQLIGFHRQLVCQ